MQNCHTILFYLPIIQLTVYKRTITRFIADDKARETGDAIGFKQQLSTTSFEALELEITGVPLNSGVKPPTTEIWGRE